MNRVDNKVVLITGGGSGIGQSSCELLAKAGAKIVVSDINLSSANETAKTIVDAGGEAIAIQHDIASEADWENALAVTVKQFETLDVLVNNAGTGTLEECKNTSLKDWQKVIDINLSGTFLGIRSAINIMQHNHTMSSIINISSTSGLVGGGRAPYSASKGGITMLTKSVAIECGRLGYDIRVNTIYPGAIDTPMNHIYEDEAKNLEAMAEHAKLIPLGRHGQPIEIARGVLFLASDDSSFMTGSALVIDGGYTAA